MGQLNICHDSEVTLKLLQTAPAESTLKLATGYFNLTSDYSWAILRDSQATCHFLTAHPTANGFFSMLSLRVKVSLGIIFKILEFLCNFVCRNYNCFFFLYYK